MKQPKITKEQLAIEVAKLRDYNAGWVSGDEQRRREFAKAFGWRKSSNPYSGETEYSLPTWIEIFVEIGKLLSAKNFMDFEVNITELSQRLGNLEENIRNEIHPNFPK